jgi:hypothetical protein
MLERSSYLESDTTGMPIVAVRNGDAVRPMGIVPLSQVPFGMMPHWYYIANI